jgi:hypothetical protein
MNFIHPDYPLFPILNFQFPSVLAEVLAAVQQINFTYNMQGKKKRTIRQDYHLQVPIWHQN